ncbi:hypothetical protein VOI54_06220 [Tamlana sp. 2201CG12-4]|uniref:tetratricopeptide repeat protein n=1 Tax=Tamlana sp. 2201CG12-4 TaxID=3112582 RepID=UPI002DBBFF90|nr:hypothetical protein [Tamlana sp. 2201CG12-4]MEC3906606.1 hypothetical protein [Tamlana sp. 2201CG12-4]
MNTPNYIVANRLNYLLNTKSIAELKLDETNLVSKFAEFVKGSKELNTYGYSLLFSGQTEKALYVFDLNSKLFPYNHNVYDSLGEAYLKVEHPKEALKNYYKILSLNPENKNARDMVEKIKNNI